MNFDDYVKPKFRENVKLCYIDKDSFNVHIKTDIYKDIVEDSENKVWHFKFWIRQTIT